MSRRLVRENDKGYSPARIDGHWQAGTIQIIDEATLCLLDAAPQQNVGPRDGKLQLWPRGRELRG